VLLPEILPCVGGVAFVPNFLAATGAHPCGNALCLSSDLSRMWRRKLEVHSHFVDL
jgi:hypothetical protein